MNIRTTQTRILAAPEQPYFWNHVNKTDTCWLWTGAIDRSGYGKFRTRQGTKLAHRWFYQQFWGPIPPHLDLDHLCRVRHCVNPAHLEPVTRQVNVDRGYPANQTHCKRGHEFTEENTRQNAAGHRWCRKCEPIRRAKYRMQKALQAVSQ